MAWVMLGHTYYFAPHFVENPLIAKTFPKQIGFQLINNATVSVDTFFVMSGFLLTYLFLKRVENIGMDDTIKSIKFWVMYYVHRYIRYQTTPST